MTHNPLSFQLAEGFFCIFTSGLALKQQFEY